MIVFEDAGSDKPDSEPTFLLPDIRPSFGFATLTEGPDLFFC